MKAHRRKRKTRYLFRLDETRKTTAHGGQILVDALCRRFGLWEQLARTPGLDPRKRRRSGHDPEALAAQIVFGLASGAVTLSDMERLGDDPVLLEAVGLERAADASTLGEWLRAQTAASVEALGELNARFVRAVLEQARPGRVRHAGQLEVFFDDTQIEVHGQKIEGARVNYNGDLALSWQTLWCGPFLLDGILDGAGSVAAHQAALLEARAGTWKPGPAYFYADSGSSAGAELKGIRAAEFAQWSVSYNKWTDVPERLAEELPAAAWGEKTQVEDETREYAWIKHRPGELDEDQLFAVCRRKKPDELFFRYGFVACESRPARTPKAVMERHNLKGACEQRFSEVLSDLDLHHPPCLALIANQAFYALATLAYNVLTALKVLDLPDHAQTWRVRTLVRHLLTVPASVVAHANRRVLKISIPAGWLKWWRLFLARFVPRRKRGESIDESYRVETG
ncbi:MAG TPA: IS1380 family transposase [Candidatus Hydrogenedentes bacterium]|nr:IS1380 family transposase [Candidatus Hydrogenedentota bacterium]